MIGINVGVPAPMAWFPFTGWNKSFFGDLHIQGIEGVQFYTQQKMTLRGGSNRRQIRTRIRFGRDRWVEWVGGPTRKLHERVAGDHSNCR